MKKYTQPTVEITAFDFEDIICESSGNSYAATKQEFESAIVNTDVQVVTVEW